MTTSAEPTPFAAYVDPARPTRAIWRLLLGAVLLVAGFLAVSLLLVVVVEVALGMAPAALADAMTAQGSRREGALGVVVALGFIALMVVPLWLVLLIVHRRGLRSAIGRVRSAHVMGGLGAVGLMFAVGLLGMMLGGWDEGLRWQGTLAGGGALVALACALVPLQSATEELVFRGWLLQQLAARFRRWTVWALLPSACFALLHLDPGLPAAERWSYVGWTFGFGLLMAWSVWRLGSLAFAITVHAANNLGALIFLGMEGPTGALAPWVVSPPTPIDAALSFGLEALVVVVVVEALARRAG